MKSRVLLVIVLIAGLILVVLFNRSKQHSVTTHKLIQGTIIEGVYGIGTVMANKSYELKPGVISMLQDVYVKEGDSVTKNQPLVNLDGIIHRAPFAGVINSFPYKKGDTAFVQNKVLSLVDYSDRYLSVSLEQQGAIRIKKGQTAKINFDSIRNETFEGIVESIYSQDQSFLARINISHLPPFIIPGMTGDVGINIKEHHNVLLAPISALDEGSVNLSTSKYKSKNIPVKTGISDGEMVEIISDKLKAGDRLELRTKPEK